jgi:hypothetical protein
MPVTDRCHEREPLPPSDSACQEGRSFRAPHEQSSLPAFTAATLRVADVQARRLYQHAGAGDAAFLLHLESCSGYFGQPLPAAPRPGQESQHHHYYRSPTHDQNPQAPAQGAAVAFMNIHPFPRLLRASGVTPRVRHFITEVLRVP